MTETPDDKQLVLMVEPDEFYAKIHRLMLRRYGYDVVVASNFELGSLLLDYCEPDIVLSAEDCDRYRNGEDCEERRWFARTEANQQFYKLLRQRDIPYIIIFSAKPKPYPCDDYNFLP